MEIKNIDQYSKTFWLNYINLTLNKNIESGEKIYINKFLNNGKEIPRPEKSGWFKKHIGEIKGQIADWRGSFIGAVKGIHIVEFNNYYECHIDRIDPLKNPIGHLIHDSPSTLIYLGIGALILYLLI